MQLTEGCSLQVSGRVGCILQRAPALAPARKNGNYITLIWNCFCRFESPRHTLGANCFSNVPPPVLLFASRPSRGELSRSPRPPLEGLSSLVPRTHIIAHPGAFGKFRSNPWPQKSPPPRSLEDHPGWRQETRCPGPQGGFCFATYPGFPCPQPSLPTLQVQVSQHIQGKVSSASSSSQNHSSACGPVARRICTVWARKMLRSANAWRSPSLQREAWRFVLLLCLRFITTV